MQVDFPDSKPHAKDMTAISHLTNGRDAQEQAASVPTEAARHLFDNQKQPPQMQTKVDAITQSVLDDLLYEAHQYDATQIASLGIPTSDRSGSTSL
jgi:hypothetical protein